MFWESFSNLTNPQTLLVASATIAAGASIIAVSMQLLVPDNYSQRMKAVISERDRIKFREREKSTNNSTQLRQEPKANVKAFVERFRLHDWLAVEGIRLRLQMAGYRHPQANIYFLFFRLVIPICLFVVSAFYFSFIYQGGLSVVVRVGIVIGCTYFGIKMPEIFLSNIQQKRKADIQKSFPDALDLLLICVESGMSIELALHKVAVEIGARSTVLAEEFAVTTAELSFLPDRRQAYENLANRTDLETVKSVCSALIQAERFGTPLGTALRVLAQEARDRRLSAAEKKASALPAKLTVPLILFFLPVLFMVIILPIFIKAQSAF